MKTAVGVNAAIAEGDERSVSREGWSENSFLLSEKDSSTGIMFSTRE